MTQARISTVTAGSCCKNIDIYMRFDLLYMRYLEPLGTVFRLFHKLQTYFTTHSLKARGFKGMMWVKYAAPMVQICHVKSKRNHQVLNSIRDWLSDNKHFMCINTRIRTKTRSSDRPSKRCFSGLNPLDKL